MPKLFSARLFAPLVVLVVMAILLFPSDSSADERLDNLIACSAIFNASFALTKNDAQKETYKESTLGYAQAALTRASEQGMTEESFKTHAAEIGNSMTVSEEELPAERSRCRSQVPLEGQQ